MQNKYTVANLILLSNQTLLPNQQAAMPEMVSNILLNNQRKASFCPQPKLKSINTSKKV